jgi:hypothetical protein
VTGLSRRSIACIGFVVAVVAVIACVALDGAASLCGFHENQTPAGYCAASQTVRFLLVAAPVSTVIVGYALSLRMGRVTPIAIAALCALAGSAVVLAAGY